MAVVRPWGVSEISQIAFSKETFLEMPGREDHGNDEDKPEGQEEDGKEDGNAKGGFLDDSAGNEWDGQKGMWRAVGWISHGRHDHDPATRDADKATHDIRMNWD